MDVCGEKEFSGKGKEFEEEDTVRNMRMHSRIHFGHIRMDCQKDKRKDKDGKVGLDESVGKKLINIEIIVFKRIYVTIWRIFYL